MQLDQYWSQRLEPGREAVLWSQVLQLLVVNRLIDPGREFRLHRHWFDQTAMADLLGVDVAVASKDRLYRCLDHLLAHKQDLFVFLRQRWQDVFHAQFDVLLYDLTSTYLEGEAEWIPSAKRGYSRDGRPDCLQLVIALVVTTDGFPLVLEVPYEVMDGDTSDKTTLKGFLAKIETMDGKAERVWVMDRGIPTEAVLKEMREADPPVRYLVGTPRAKMRKMEQQWLELPWRKVRESVSVKLAAEGGEMYVLAKSEGRQPKVMAMGRKKLARLLWKLRAMRRSCPASDQLLLRIGAAKAAAGRAFGFVEIQLPSAK